MWTIKKNFVVLVNQFILKFKDKLLFIHKLIRRIIISFLLGCQVILTLLIKLSLKTKKVNEANLDDHRFRIKSLIMIIHFQCKCEKAINWIEVTAMNKKGTVSHTSRILISIGYWNWHRKLGLYDSIFTMQRAFTCHKVVHHIMCWTFDLFFFAII